jgi:HSP20 family protein
MPERDLFANFERMRREMEELLPRRTGFTPAVDVYYAGNPPCAVVRADLAGIDPDEVTLEVRGRELVISGQRAAESSNERLYQQLEIHHGPFRRVVALGADVDADAADARYEDGMLIVELPLARPGRARKVPIRGSET